MRRAVWFLLGVLGVLLATMCETIVEELSYR